MHLIPLLILIALLAACTTPTPTPIASKPQATTPDAIDRLATKLSASHGLWLNGLYPSLELSATVTPQEVIHKCFSMGLSQGERPNYKILDLRQIEIQGIQPESYWAALLQIDSTEKIFLFRYNGHHWWSRLYETAPSP